MTDALDTPAWTDPYVAAPTLVDAATALTEVVGPLVTDGFPTELVAALDDVEHALANIKARADNGAAIFSSSDWHGLRVGTQQAVAAARQERSAHIEAVKNMLERGDVDAAKQLINGLLQEQ